MLKIIQERADSAKRWIDNIKTLQGHVIIMIKQTVSIFLLKKKVLMGKRPGGAVWEERNRNYYRF